MDTPRNFRSAFNGFNRQDVVHYLEYINAKHTSQVNQLNAEIDALRAQPTALVENDCQLELKALQTRCDVLTAQLEAAEAANAELLARLEAAANQPAAPQEPEVPVAAPEPAPAPVAAAPAPISNELDFYRRAEQAEREARDRAELTYFQVSGVLNQATAKVEDIASEITDMADNVMSQLTQLQVAISGSKHTLQDAAAIMKTIRPNK